MTPIHLNQTFSQGFSLSDTIGPFLSQTEVAKVSSVSREFQAAMKATKQDYIEKISALNPETSFLAKFLTESGVLPVDLNDANKQVLLTKKVVALMSTVTGTFKNVFGINPACEGTEISIDRLDLKMKLLEEISLNKVFEKIIEQIAPERRPQIELRTTIDPNKTMEVNEREIKEAADSIRRWVANAANPSLDDQQAPAESPLNTINFLDLQNLDITNIPRELNYLPNLSTLYLSNNPIFFFPDSLRLPNLEKLVLASTSIEQLPNNLDICTPRLTNLDLIRTQLTSLPDRLNNLRLLTTIKLWEARLESLPENFNPPSLETLDIGLNKISRLPDAFNPPNLMQLEIGCTEITRLPDAFNPPNLLHFSAYNTPLKDIPNSFRPSQLNSLNVSNTAIEYLPDICGPNLFFLNLSHTRIEHLPTNWQPFYVGEMKIDNTRITSLPAALTNNLRNPRTPLLYEAYKQIGLNRLRMTTQNIQSVANQALAIGSYALSEIKKGLSYAHTQTSKMLNQFQRQTVTKLAKSTKFRNMRFSPYATQSSTR